LDSWALLALLEDEPAAGEVRALLVAAQEANTALWITSVNLGEIWYAVARRHGPKSLVLNRSWPIGT
jgi:PIN domain nuclease of toxin-antitoxin system